MGLTRAEKKKRLIKKDLLKQLDLQGKTGSYFEDMVEEYIFMWQTKSDLQEDINKNGIRVTVKSGNGFNTEKINDSVPLLLKYNNQMLKLLSELKLQEPTLAESNDVDDYC